ELRATAAPVGAVGAGPAAHGLVAGAGGEVVWPGAGVRPGVSAPGWPPDQYDAGPTDARDEPVLRGCATPARQCRGVWVALPGVGAAAQLPALAPGDGAGQRGLAQPGGAPEP